MSLEWFQHSANNVIHGDRWAEGGSVELCVDILLRLSQ